VSREVEVHVPDIGDFEAVDVVEILVAPGDRVAVEDPLVSLESDKATMEVPSPVAGEILSVKVALGDAVSEGSLLVVVAAVDAPEATPPGAGAEPVVPNGAESPPMARFAHPQPESQLEAPNRSRARSQPQPPVEALGVDRPVRAHAGPGIRRFARELGVDLAEIDGSGRAGRVVEADLKQHVRTVFEGGHARSAAASLPARTADVTDLEAFRRRVPRSADDDGPSTLAVVLKAALAALRAFPELTGVADAGGGSGGLAVAVSGASGQASAPVVVAGADRLGLRDLTRAVRDGSAAQTAQPLFTLHCEADRGGRPPQPVRTPKERFALGLGAFEVVPRWTGSPDDALDAERSDAFEPRLVLPIAIETAPDVDASVADRFLDHWAEILAAPARLLL